MCGICGVYEKDRDHRPLVREMVDILAHRGPDHVSVYQSGPVCLGHRRLSIIDLSSGNQPIFNADQTLAIVFNGEIYNYQELREGLCHKGYRFNTDSDTEVILKLFEDQGVDAFQQLNGIFAIAILDQRAEQKRLILARDPFGIKPLHYYAHPRRFLFASEQKAILLHPQVERALNVQALHSQLNLRYTQGTETLFQNIQRLLPGHYLILKDNKILKIACFRQLKCEIDHKLTEKDWLEAIPFYLKQAIRRQLVSDVPIGVYLSGGMDSGSIVAMMREIGVQKISTFTLGFNEPTDENEAAGRLAKHYETDHHDLRMELHPMRLMPEVIWHAEEPKINLLQGFLMSKFVSAHVKVVLGGLGGDELFSGYDIHRFIYPFNHLHRQLTARIEKRFSRKMSGFIYMLQQKIGSMKTDEYRRGLQMALACGNIKKFYLILRNVWDYDAAHWRKIYTSHFLQQGIIHPIENAFRDYFPERHSHLSALEQVYWAEFHTKMVNDYLLTEDRMSMSHSVEERVPFLDPDLVQLGFRIPASLKMKGLQTKYILRKAMQPYLPEHTLKKKKWGFTINPYLQFQKDLKVTAERILTRKRIEQDGIFNYPYIQQILNAPPHPRMRWHYNFIWVLTGFYIWKQMFLESNAFKEKQVDLDSYCQG